MKARLLQIAKGQREEFQSVLTRYAVERFLYRLSHSVHTSNFVLKGATLFAHWTGEIHRPTRDLDFLSFGDPRVPHIEDVFVSVCNEVVEEDGLVFLPETVSATILKEDQEYEGVRITLLAMLGKARIPLQIDIGFGDAVTPSPEPAELPAMLNLPSARLLVYPRETVVAEKCEAIIHLGLANSRLKDFYDLWYLATHFDFDGPLLARALRATFHRRGTESPLQPPPALTAEYYNDPARLAQWRAFIQRINVQTGQPSSLEDTVQVLLVFLMPLLTSVRTASSFSKLWKHPDLSWHNSP